MSWPKARVPAPVGLDRVPDDRDGSRLYLQTTADVELAVRSGKGGLTVTLQNCRIHMRNAARPLDTSFFRTPVKLVSVHQRKKDIEVDIALREIANSTPRKLAGRTAASSGSWIFPSRKAQRRLI